MGQLDAASGGGGVRSGTYWSMHPKHSDCPTAISLPLTASLFCARDLCVAPLCLSQRLERGQSAVQRAIVLRDYEAHDVLGLRDAAPNGAAVACSPAQMTVPQQKDGAAGHQGPIPVREGDG